MSQVPKKCRIAWDTFAGLVITSPGGAFGAKAAAAFTDPQAQPVATAMFVMMAGTTADIAIARENFIIK